MFGRLVDTFKQNVNPSQPFSVNLPQLYSSYGGAHYKVHSNKEMIPPLMRN